MGKKENAGQAKLNQEGMYETPPNSRNSLFNTSTFFTGFINPFFTF
jgi:hypothetical protein